MHPCSGGGLKGLISDEVRSAQFGELRLHLGSDNGPCRVGPGHHEPADGKEGSFQDSGPGVLPGPAMRGPGHHPGVLVRVCRCPPHPCPQGAPSSVGTSPPRFASGPRLGASLVASSRLTAGPWGADSYETKELSSDHCPGLDFHDCPVTPFVATLSRAVCRWQVQQSHRHGLIPHPVGAALSLWMRAKGQGSTKRGWLHN